MGSILASIFPGVREVRSPLAAGFLWLTCGWLLFRNSFTQASLHEGIARDLASLANWLGKPALFVVASFVAYLIGLLSTSISSYIFTILSRTKIPVVSRFRKDEPPFSKEGYNAAQDLIYQQVFKALDDSNTRTVILNDHHKATPVVMAIRSHYLISHRKNLAFAHLNLKPYFDALIEDLNTVPYRLLAKRPEAFSSFDRVRSEGEFRSALVLPLVAMALYFWPSLHWLSSFIFILILILAWQARNKLIAANDQLVEFLRADVGVTSPAIEAVDGTSIRLSRVELTAPEIEIIRSLAETYLTEQPTNSIELYEILAKTGNARFNEILCRLTKKYRPDLLEARLGEGALYSNHLHVPWLQKFVIDHDEIEDLTKVLLRALAFRVSDTESKVFAPVLRAGFDLNKKSIRTQSNLGSQSLEKIKEIDRDIVELRKGQLGPEEFLLRHDSLPKDAWGRIKEFLSAWIKNNGDWWIIADPLFEAKEPKY
jgi:hypothetical protein